MTYVDTRKSFSLSCYVMKISLVQCPGWTVDTPPLGIAYLSAYLKDHGHDVVLHDFNIDAYASLPEKYHYLWDQTRSHWLEDKFDQRRFFRDHVERWGREIVDTPSHVVGLSIYESTYKLSCKVARFVRAADPQRAIVFGGEGCVPGSREMDYLLRNVDHCYFVIGEGEQSLLEFVEAVERGDDIEKIPGLGLNVRGTLKQGPKRKPLRDLDTLPYPDFDSFPLGKYRKSSDIPILGSRGCVARCAFCSDHVFWQRCRWRSAENIVGEMLYRFEKGIRSFRFCDLLINANMAEFENLCDRILESDMVGSINVNGQFRCHSGMKGKLLDKAKKAGLDFIGYGVESGSQTILDRMRKNYSLKTIESNLEATHRAGILTSINIIVGFPGETDQTLDETIEFIKRNSPYIDMIQDLNTFKIRPSSPVATDLDGYGIVHKSKDPDAWESKDGRNTMLWRLEGCRRVYRTAEAAGIRFGFSEYNLYYHPLMQQALLETAHRHMAAGDYAEAMDVFQRNMSMNPEALHLLPELEGCYLHLQEPGKRKFIFFLKEFFAELPPKLLDILSSPKGLSSAMVRELKKENFFVDKETDGKTHLFSGKYYLNLRDYDQAILHLKKAGELLSDPALSFHDLGECYLELGEIDRAYDYLQRAVEEGAQNDWTLPVLGLVSEMKGEPSEAEKYYREHRGSEELGRESRIYALFRLMKIRLEAGERDEAFGLLGEVTWEKPDEVSTGGRLRIADALADLRAVNVKLAAECYRFLVDWFPDNDEFWEGLFESLVLAGNPDGLVEFVRLALRHQSGGKVARRLFERGVGEDVVRMLEEHGERMGESGRWMLHTAGRYWRLAGQSKRAMSCYQRALERTEEDEPVILRDMGECHLELGELDEAKSFFEKALNLNFDLERVHYDMGLVSEGQGDPEGARVRYLANLKVGGQESRSYLLALVRLAAMSLAEGDADRSQSFLERAEEVEDEEDLEAKGALAYMWARVKGSRGRSEEAVSFLREAVKAQPKRQEYVMALFGELKSCGREEELTQEIADLAGLADAEVLASLLGRVEGVGEMMSRFEKEAAGLEGGDRSGLLSLLARYRKDQGDPRRALVLYRKVKACGGEETGEILKDMGECHLELDEPDEARKVLEKALEVNPELEWANYDMGIVCEREGNPEGAKEYYHKDLKGGNRSPWNSLMTFVRLAELSLAEGDVDKARELLEKAEEYDDKKNMHAKGALAYRWAQVERGRGRGEEVVSHLREAVKAEPQCEEYAMALVAELGRCGNVEELIHAAIAMIGEVRVEVLARMLGEMEIGGESAAGIEEQAAGLKNEDAPKLLYLIARYWKDQGDPRRALVLYGKVTACGGEETGEILRDMGECYLELSELDEARKFLERALSLNPELEWVDFDLGLVSEREGDPEGARARYLRNLEGCGRNPSCVLISLVRLSEFCLEEGDLAGAEEWLKKGEPYLQHADSLPKAAWAFGRAKVARGRGMRDEVLSCLQEAVRLDPQRDEYRMELSLELEGRRSDP